MIDQVQNPVAGEQPLTKRQTEILEFIQEYLDDNGYPPTVRDIGKAVVVYPSALPQRQWFEHYQQTLRTAREHMVNRPRLFIDTLQANTARHAGAAVIGNPAAANSATASLS